MREIRDRACAQAQAPSSIAFGANWPKIGPERSRSAPNRGRTQPFDTRSMQNAANLQKISRTRQIDAESMQSAHTLEYELML